MIRKIIQVAIIFFTTTIFISCGSDLEVIEDLSNSNFALLNQDSSQIIFPSSIKKKIGIVGYIFTNCPDICPLTTNNMRLIRDQIENEGIENIEFVSISFDPEVDKPKVLKEFSELHGVAFSNWEFLTGKKSVIENLMKEVGVVAFIGDSTVFKDGSKEYYYVHTDRIQLFDQEGRVRKNYLGSQINVKEVVTDIKQLN